MNVLNYATLEPSQRLVDAGIVLETDFYFCQDNDGWYLRSEGTYHRDSITSPIPAPSMAEVWRELPEELIINGGIKDYFYRLEITRYRDATEARYGRGIWSKVFCDINPTDALIDLLIWARKERGRNEL